MRDSSGRDERMSLTLRGKMLFISVAILCVAVGANTLFSSILFRREYSKALQEKVFVIGQILAFQLEEYLESGQSLDQLKGFETQCRELVTWYSDLSYAMVVDPNGRILFRDTPSETHQVISDLDILRGIESQENVSQVHSGKEGPFYDFTMPVFGLDGKHVAAVRIGFPLRLISQETGGVIIRFVGFALVFFGLGILMLVISVNFWVAKPLGKLLALIQDLGQQKTDAPRPIEIDSDNELSQVASVFQQMKLEIKESDEKIRRYTRDLEIKTRQSSPALRASYERLKQYIIERKCMEEALWEVQRKYQTILESIEDGYYESDLEGNLTFFNDSLCRILGYPEEELMSMNMRQFSDEATANRVSQAIEKVYTTGKPAKALHFEIIRKDGIRRHLEASVSVVKDSEDQPVGLRGTIRDITARRWMEEALRESEKRYRTILESIEDGYYEVDIAGNLTFFNDALCRMFGYSRDELMGMNNRDYMSPEESEKAYRIFNKVYKTGKATRIADWRFIRKDGRNIHIETSISLIRDSDGEPVGFRGVVRDITERKEMEEVLNSEKEKFQVIVEESPLAICLIGEDGKFEYLNPAFVETFGYAHEDLPTIEEWQRKAFPDKKSRNKIETMLTVDREVSEGGQTRVMGSVDVRCKDGSTKTVNSLPVKMKSGRILVMTADQTERRRLEEQLHHAQKMEAIGTLAGGIAHDFNNLLMAIQGNTSLMLFNTDENHPHYGMLKSIEEQVKSGGALTSQLLGYARKGKYKPSPIDLNQLIEESSEAVARTRKEITIQRELADNLPAVSADPGQIQQVLLNLCINAADAMAGGGDLFLKTAKASDEVMKEHLCNVIPGEYVVITITDTGIGMDKETQSRIFDPFFTTKEVGQGTGLGLASSYGIIKNHDGYISVESEKGRGSTFSVYLPASDTAVDTPTVENDDLQIELMRGTETILLVDDEDTVLKVGSALLKKLGYELVEARSGEEAIEKYGANKATIALVILDMIMPEMSGGSVYDRLKELNPDVKVLLSSGYSIDGQAKDILERGCDGFIQKPFDIKDLSVTIRQLVDKDKS
jgi:two-component system cell cycle sensor histidine kinase/response regulator CckA